MIRIGISQQFAKRVIKVDIAAPVIPNIGISKKFNDRFNSSATRLDTIR